MFNWKNIVDHEEVGPPPPPNIVNIDKTNRLRRHTAIVKQGNLFIIFTDLYFH